MPRSFGIATFNAHGPVPPTFPFFLCLSHYIILIASLIFSIGLLALKESSLSPMLYSPFLGARVFAILWLLLATLSKKMSQTYFLGFLSLPFDVILSKKHQMVVTKIPKNMFGSLFSSKWLYDVAFTRRFDINLHHCLPSDGLGQVDSSGSKFDTPEELQRLDYAADILHGPNAHRKPNRKLRRRPKRGERELLKHRDQGRRRESRVHF